MPKPTPPDIVAEILRLRDGGITQREIHSKTGVPISTVGSICSRLQRKKAGPPGKKATGIVPPNMSRKPEPCPNCKAKVYLPAAGETPCVACQVRRTPKHPRMGGT